MSKIYYRMSAIYAQSGGDGVEVEAYPLSKILGKNASNIKARAIEALKNLNPQEHKVTNTNYRPDRQVFKPSGLKDPITGVDIMTTDFEPVAKVPIRVQKYIISQKASFARGNGVTLKPSDENSEVFKRVYDNWYANKTDFYLKEIAEKYLGETQVGVIFFNDFEGSDKNLNKYRIRHKIVSPSKGDFLYPVYDPNTEKLVSVCREYEMGEETVYDMYIAPEGPGQKVKLRTYTSLDDTAYTETELNFSKLNVIVFEKDEAECEDTQEAIEMLEKSFSDFLDQVEYSGDPILFGKGKTLDMPAKGTSGKYIEGSEDSDLKFVTPDDNSTEPRELAFDKLEKYIFSLNRAAVLDLDVMKNLSDVSGAALDRYLTDVYMEAEDNQRGYFGLGVQRMVNFMLQTWKDRMLAPDDETTIDVEFKRFKVDDLREKVETILLANGNKPVIDHMQSISAVGLADDPSVAYDRLKEEAKEGLFDKKQTAIAEQAQQRSVNTPGTEDNGGN